MNTGKILRNAGSHRILYALSFAPKTSKELKLVAGAIYSIAKFDAEYMDRMRESGYVRQTLSTWSLTKRGAEKLEELGAVTGMNPNRGKTSPLIDRPAYIPAIHNPSRPARPGSEEFLSYPSRVGNRLFYRDGTVAFIEE